MTEITDQTPEFKTENGQINLFAERTVEDRKDSIIAEDLEEFEKYTNEMIAKNEDHDYEEHSTTEDSEEIYDSKPTKPAQHSKFFDKYKSFMFSFVVNLYFYIIEPILKIYIKIKIFFRHCEIFNKIKNFFTRGERQIMDIRTKNIMDTRTAAIEELFEKILNSSIMWEIHKNTKKEIFENNYDISYLIDIANNKIADEIYKFLTISRYKGDKLLSFVDALYYKLVDNEITTKINNYCKAHVLKSPSVEWDKNSDPVCPLNYDEDDQFTKVIVNSFVQIRDIIKFIISYKNIAINLHFKNIVDEEETQEKKNTKETKEDFSSSVYLRNCNYSPSIDPDFQELAMSRGRMKYDFTRK